MAFFVPKRRASRTRRSIAHAWLLWLWLILLLGMVGRQVYDSHQRLRHRAFSETMVATPDQLVGVLNGLFPTDAPWQWREENGIRVDNAGLRYGTQGIVATGATYASATHDRVNMSFLVLDYGRATEATLHFWRLAPAALAAERSWHWVDVPYHSQHAHKQKAACMAFDTHGCQYWSLWYRYGRYILRMDIAILDPAFMDMAALRQLVATSEQAFWQGIR